MTTKEQMYNLVIGQLLNDGHKSLAKQLSDTVQLTVEEPSNDLFNVIKSLNMASKICAARSQPTEPRETSDVGQLKESAKTTTGDKIAEVFENEVGLKVVAATPEEKVVTSAAETESSPPKVEVSDVKPPKVTPEGDDSAENVSETVKEQPQDPENVQGDVASVSAKLVVDSADTSKSAEVEATNDSSVPDINESSPDEGGDRKGRKRKEATSLPLVWIEAKTDTSLRTKRGKLGEATFKPLLVSSKKSKEIQRTFKFKNVTYTQPVVLLRRMKESGVISRVENKKVDLEDLVLDDTAKTDDLQLVLDSSLDETAVVTNADEHKEPKPNAEKKQPGRRGRKKKVDASSLEPETSEAARQSNDDMNTKDTIDEKSNSDQDGTLEQAKVEAVEDKTPVRRGRKPKVSSKKDESHKDDDVKPSDDLPADPKDLPEDKNGEDSDDDDKPLQTKEKTGKRGRPKKSAPTPSPSDLPADPKDLPEDKNVENSDDDDDEPLQPKEKLPKRGRSKKSQPAPTPSPSDLPADPENLPEEKNVEDSDDDDQPLKPNGRPPKRGRPKKDSQIQSTSDSLADGDGEGTSQEEDKHSKDEGAEIGTFATESPKDTTLGDKENKSKVGKRPAKKSTAAKGKKVSTTAKIKNKTGDNMNAIVKIKRLHVFSAKELKSFGIKKLKSHDMKIIKSKVSPRGKLKIDLSTSEKDTWMGLGTEENGIPDREVDNITPLLVTESDFGQTFDIDSDSDDDETFAPMQATVDSLLSGIEDGKSPSASPRAKDVTPGKRGRKRKLSGRTTTTPEDKKPHEKLSNGVDETPRKPEEDGGYKKPKTASEMFAELMGEM